MARGKLFIVSAPSGAGKTSLVEAVLPRLQQKCSIDRLVTYTSRQMRPGEQEGIDFCYITPKEFKCRVQQGFFLEWSKEYHHYYGSPKSVEDALRNGDSKVLVIDRNGAKQVLQRVSEVVTLWVSVSSIDILRQRLIQRGANSLGQIESRIAQAKIELDDEARNGLYKYHVLNENFDEAAKKIEEIFLKELKIL